MSEPPSETNARSAADDAGPCGRKALLQKHRWLTFLLPLIVYMLVNSLEPTPESADDTSWLPSVPYQYYPIVYSAKIVLTVIAMLFVLPGYREFPFKISPLAVAVGVAGIVVWVGLCSLDLERTFLVPLLKPIRLDLLIAAGTRPGYNPLERLAACPVGAWGFLAVRFFGLVVIMAVIEEFFLRGFLMRFAVDDRWWELPIGKVNTAAVLIGALLYPALTHPAELLAAVAWFSMVTWLMVKTRNIWDCVAAHAITNLLLGVYVVITGEWKLM